MLLHRRLRGRVHHPGLVELRRPRHQPGSGPDPVLKSPHPAWRDSHMGKMLPEDRKELYSRWEVTIGYANHFNKRIRDRCDKEGFAGSPTTLDGKLVPCKLNLCWGFIVQVYVVIFPSTLFVQKKDLEVRTTRVRVPDPYQSNPITLLYLSSLWPITCSSHRFINLPCLVNTFGRRKQQNSITRTFSLSLSLKHARTNARMHTHPHPRTHTHSHALNFTVFSHIVMSFIISRHWFLSNVRSISAMTTRHKETQKAFPSLDLAEGEWLNKSGHVFQTA